MKAGPLPGGVEHGLASGAIDAFADEDSADRPGGTRVAFGVRFLKRLLVDVATLERHS